MIFGGILGLLIASIIVIVVIYVTGGLDEWLDNSENKKGNEDKNGNGNRNGNGNGNNGLATTNSSGEGVGGKTPEGDAKQKERKLLTQAFDNSPLEYETILVYYFGYIPANLNNRTFVAHMYDRYKNQELISQEEFLENVRSVIAPITEQSGGDINEKYIEYLESTKDRIITLPMMIIMTAGGSPSDRFDWSIPETPNVGPGVEIEQRFIDPNTGQEIPVPDGTAHVEIVTGKNNGVVTVTYTAYDENGLIVPGPPTNPSVLEGENVGEAYFSYGEEVPEPKQWEDVMDRLPNESNSDWMYRIVSALFGGAVSWHSINPNDFNQLQYSGSADGKHRVDASMLDSIQQYLNFNSFLCNDEYRFRIQLASMYDCNNRKFINLPADLETDYQKILPEPDATLPSYFDSIADGRVKINNSHVWLREIIELLIGQPIENLADEFLNNFYTDVDQISRFDGYPYPRVIKSEWHNKLNDLPNKRLTGNLVKEIATIFCNTYSNPRFCGSGGASSGCSTSTYVTPDDSITPQFCGYTCGGLTTKRCSPTLKDCVGSSGRGGSYTCDVSWDTDTTCNWPEHKTSFDQQTNNFCSTGILV